MSFTIRTAHETDAHDLAPNLRLADLRECEGFGVNPLSSLLTAVSDGLETLTLVGRDDEVLGMFGLGIRHPQWNLTTIWLLGTDTLIRDLGYRKKFWIESKQYVNDWCSEQGTIGNMVHAANVVHIAWLQKLQFQINTTHPILSPKGHHYYPFVRSHICASPPPSQQ